MNKKFLLTLKIFFYELFPNFMLEKIDYSLEGHCCMCGDCCRFIYCLEPFSRADFNLVAFFLPKYKRFKIIGEDENNNLILACSLIREDGMCPDYEKRPGICRDYPNPAKIYSGGKLYKRCTYKLIPEKTFESYLEK